MLLLRVLILILSALCQVSESKQVFILPSSRQIVINEGETLNIACIYTRIRSKYFDGYEWNLQQSETESFYENWEKTIYQYNISKENAVLSDTGWYYCAIHDDYRNNTISYFYNTEVNWFFVYVKPKMFIVNETTTIHLNVSDYFTTIACGSTSKNVLPLLFKGNKFEISKVSFDLRVTFTLNPTYRKDSYKCSIKIDNETARLHALNSTLLVKDTETILLYGQENDTFYVQKRSGDNVEIGATVYEDEGKSLLQWFKPNGEKIMNSPKYYVTFIRYNDNMVTFALLQIIDINLMDSGNYTLQSQHDYSSAKKNFSLDVTSKPISLLSLNESYYSPNQSTEFHCEIISNPPSNVTWSFFKYPHYPSFKNEMTVYLTNVTQRLVYNSGYKIKSMVKMPIEVSGKIKCEACNTLGCDSKNETIFVSDGLGAFGIIGPRESVVQGDNIELICAASVYNYSDYFAWTVRVNQTEKPVIETERLKVVQHRTRFTHRSTLKLNNVQKSDAQDYFCTGEIMNTLNQETLNLLSNNAIYTLIIHDPILPFFTNTNMNRSKTRNIDIITEDHNTVTLQCFADGMPKPEVTWYKDNVLLKENNQYLFKYNYQELHIKYFMPHDSGIYSCQAISRVGTNETYQHITVKYTKWYTFDIILVISLSILGFILMILAIFITIKVCREKKMRKKLVPDLIYFDGVTLEYVNPNSTVKDQAQFLSYDKKWEFPKERLKLKEKLDSGNFGVVKKAEALGICKNETVTTVAVKMVRQSDDPTYFCALVNELKIMLHLGKHLNVVNLLGTCTQNILKGELLVIIEYCHFGNLHKYLLSHRDYFINQIDSKTGKLDLTIGADILKTVNVGNDSSAKSDTDVVVQYYPGTNPDSSKVNILSDCAHNSNSYQSKRRSNNCIKYKNLHFKPVCTQDLLSWSFQVARGMEYISQRKVLHGDLAARNILLADDNVVKICDFGLAKDMYKDCYQKKGNAPMPIKWMAIESIRNGIFSTQSDVWSFGIMLWEFFTLAKVPYPDIVIKKLSQKLIKGYRMEQPDYAIREIYDIMLQCWEAKPTSRPSFTNLVESIGKLLEESVKTHYINLNTPYMDKNEENLNLNLDCSKDES